MYSDYYTTSPTKCVIPSHIEVPYFLCHRVDHRHRGLGSQDIHKLSNGHRGSSVDPMSMKNRVAGDYPIFCLLGYPSMSGKGRVSYLIRRFVKPFNAGITVMWLSSWSTRRNSMAYWCFDAAMGPALRLAPKYTGVIN